MTSRLNSTDRAILRLAIPALGALAIDPLLTLADTGFVARLGTTELAALGVDTAILGFAFFAFNFLASVITPLVARALGRGNEDEARRWVGDALVLAVGLGVLVAVVVLLAAPLFVDLMGATGDVVDPAISYLRIRAFAAPAVLIVTAGHGAFRGHKDTRTPLLVAVGVNALNLVLDPLLIFSFGLGLEGAALATLIAQYGGAVWFLWLIRSRRMASRPSGLSEAIPSLLALGRNGAMLTARTALLLMAFTVAASTATRIGPETIAAHQLVVQIFLLTALIADSFAIAAQAMVGETAGAGDAQPVHVLSKRLVMWGVVAGLMLTVFLLVGRYPLSLLASDAVVADLTVGAGGVAAAIEIPGALVFVGDGIFLGLLGLGAMVVSTGLGAAAAVGLMMFTPMGETINGIWWALGVMMVIRGLVFLATYRRSVEIAVKS
ncbi:MAG: MATE family efflux transporter [Actinomycetota bacterium]|nr:MATE family efflux transporter [Actinomycetota bacterium]